MPGQGWLPGHGTGPVDYPLVGQLAYDTLLLASIRRPPMSLTHLRPSSLQPYRPRLCAVQEQLVRQVPEDFRVCSQCAVDPLSLALPIKTPTGECKKVSQRPVLESCHA